MRKTVTRLLVLHAASSISRWSSAGFITSLESKVLWLEASVLSNSREHLWSNLIFVVKGKDYIRPTRTGKNLMRTGFAFDVPAEAEKRTENALGFG
jgi:hypothetical protein